MVRVPSKEEFHGLFDPEAEHFRDMSLVWSPAARGYTIWQGKIRARPGPPQGGFPSPNPFAHTDLFYSFARLGASGEPSESRIMEWVSQNGLLTRKDESVSGASVLGDGAVNQQPISVEDFRSEVSRARAMLELYAEIRRLDVRALNARIAQPRSAVDRQLASYFSENPSFQQVMDRLDIWLFSLAIRSVLGAADKVLAELMSESIAGVCPRAIEDTLSRWLQTKNARPKCVLRPRTIECSKAGIIRIYAPRCTCSSTCWLRRIILCAPARTRPAGCLSRPPGRTGVFAATLAGLTPAITDNR